MHCFKTPDNLLNGNYTYSDSLHSQPSGLFWINKNKLFAKLPGKLHYNGLLCIQELNLGAHKFYLTYDWYIFSFNHLHDMFHFNWVSSFYSTLWEEGEYFNYYKYCIMYILWCILSVFIYLYFFFFFFFFLKIFLIL